MKITLSMIKERLIKKGIQISQEKGEDIPVFDIRLGRNCVGFKNVLMVRADNATGTEGILCECNNSSFLVENMPLEVVFNNILEARQYYNEWESRLILAAYDDAPLQELVDITVPMIEEPIFIANWQGEILAYSIACDPDAFSHSSQRELWGSIVATNRLPINKVQHLRESPNLQSVLYGANSSIQYFPDYDYTCIIGNLHHGKDVHMYLHISEHEHPVTQNMCVFADILLDAMRKKRSVEYAKLTSLASIFRNLLSEDASVGEDLDWALLTLGWDEASRFYLLYFESDEGSLIADALCGQLEFELPKCLTYIYEDMPLSLLHEEDLDEALPRIAALAANMGFRCGASLPFSDWASLPLYLSQAREAVKYGNGDEVISMCVDHAWPYIIDRIKIEATSKQLSHPAVPKLAEHDARYETKLLLTLFTYLTNERNAALTSEKLFIHRNTLQYRLKQISELVTLDLDDPTIRAHLLVSCAIEGVE